LLAVKATGVKNEQTWRASATGWGAQRNIVRYDGRTVRVLPQAYRRYKRGFCAGSTQTQHVAERRAQQQKAAGEQECAEMKCKCVERNESAMNYRC
jgi:hypothetical protein